MTSIRDHLKERHINFELHRPMIDEVERTATFYFWNVSGAIVGYQQYRPDVGKARKNHPKDARYFTYRLKHTVGVWGVESLNLTPGIMFLSEGIFDACRMTDIGCSALGTICNDPRGDILNWIRTMPGTKVVVADNDAAGRKLHKAGDYVEVVPEQFGDLGAASPEYCQWLKEKYCV